MKDFIDVAWTIVNDAETEEQIGQATEWVKSYVNDNDLFDDLMTALSYKFREMHL